ncbi:MAG: malonic semialdehyde reductase [Parachlamydiaceae bacterium]|nr:malonic semialdehyde reductase [Parachlamydiaceae bacterium]
MNNHSKLNDACLNQLFLEARSFNVWQDKRVSEEIIYELYDLLKMGPTSANGCPARFLFIKSKEAKGRLIPCLMEKNINKTMQAPLNVIVSWDNEFYEYFKTLTPNQDWKPFFEGKLEMVHSTVFRNSSLQGAYMILAARALGLDCGPMSGFDNGKVDKEFFSNTTWRSNFICNIGYGDISGLYPRNPRLEFGDACEII